MVPRIPCTGSDLGVLLLNIHEAAGSQGSDLDVSTSVSPAQKNITANNSSKENRSTRTWFMPAVSAFQVPGTLCCFS